MTLELEAPPRAFRWTLDDDGMAEIVFDVPGQSVNTLNGVVLQELEALLDEVAGERSVRCALLVSGKPKGFCAGADIHEIEAVTDPDDARRKVVRGQKVFQRLATLPFPAVAGIHGLCLGGGLELALACAHRIAAEDAELGLPEVNLGIFPAWGGTQRLPRLIGAASAVDLICSARRVSGKEARRLGLVDRACPPRELLGRARAFAHELAVGRTPGPEADGRARRVARDPGAPGRLRRLALEGNPVGRKVLFAQARKRILARTGGHYPAPLRALQAMEEGLEGSVEAGLALEARLVSDLVVSPISKNLIHVFGLFRSVERSPLANTRAGEAPLARAGVVGAGVMGGGIAALLASAQIEVRLKDVDTGRVAEGLRAARQALESRRRRGRIDRRALRRRMNRIAGTTTYAGFGRVDLVIEAVVEDLSVKRRVLGEVGERTPPRAWLCTNTSALPVGEIAGAVRDRTRVAGLHFFNPVDRMPLVEVVRARETSDEAVAALYRLALRLRKKPVVVRDAPGFLVNRILMRYLNEAVHLVGEGVGLEAVDGAMTAFGMPVGPLALLDDIGLDVAGHVGKTLADAFPRRMEPAPLFRALEASGRRGRKGGRGFYVYEGTSRKGADPALRKELVNWIPAADEGALTGGTETGPAADAAAGSGWEGSEPQVGSMPPAVSGIPVALEPESEARRPPAAVEIEHRLVFPMIDEAALCLADGVVGSASELDLAMIAGTGFPAFRGGLLRYADALGVEAVVSGLGRRALELGKRFEPSPALREVAERGGFYALHAQPAGGQHRGPGG